jgi:hypothetical protein
MMNRARHLITHSVVAAKFVLLLSSCASHSVKMIHPQSGATAECSGSGYGIGAGFSDGFVSGCMRAYENRGFVRLESLTPEQRASLERRGLLPNN